MSPRSTSVAHGLQPIGRVNLVQTVVQQLRGQILQQRFGPEGELPPEGNLCEAFGVSRTVIREAMRTLRAQGMVEVSQGRTPRVKRADPQVTIDSLDWLLRQSQVSLLHLIEARRPLEAEIAALAAERATPMQIAPLQEAITAQGAASSLKRQIEADIRFHDLLAEASGNPVFAMLLRTLASLLRQSREKTLSRTGKERALVGHRAILEAVGRHKPDEARAAMLDHLAMAEQDLRR